MKETGLMFKAPLVRAILSGQKTQTRRVVKPQPPEDRLHRSVDAPDSFVAEGEHTWWSGTYTQGIYHSAKCPFGKRGDRIYVRETWCQQADDDGCLIDNVYWYRATDPDVMDSEDMEKSPWRPSIHMPKSAARIWLEVTGVRVERLQDISNEDAIAEGVNRISHGREGDYYSAIRNEQHPKNWTYPDDAFRELWESTGGDWAANPWVWVIDFKRIDRRTTA
ncbi:ASCH domain-containing protein [Comamonas testosteroni]|uniref:Uncharacterized protein n=1 Tax=Comamonas testosteroni TaxID=285 RepID=A0A096FD86_COMTE|nr:ASCH domain-containing protein [Comamonas testosteroni]KGH27743.1 hypothetical protein P353_17010 [Comamonas testosteroni]